MRNCLLLLSIALIFSVFFMLTGQNTMPVTALGASDNATIPAISVGEQPLNEITPPVEYTWLGPSSQPADSPAGIIPSFRSTQGQGKPTVNSSDNWYLDIDINRPGWIYIYEYFPIGQPSQGHWLAYKFQLPESGVWQFGPFAPSNDMAEGQHAYRFWFYSNGQWATGSSNTTPNDIIYWTYTKSLPVEAVTPSTSAEKGITSKVYEFFTMPLVIGACLFIVTASLTGLIVYLWRRRMHHPAPPYTKPICAETGESLPMIRASAKLTLPNGIDINIYDATKVIGRAELSRALSLDDLALVSRQHFKVEPEDTGFYIEDLGSSNGTHLNGKDISGKGLIKLNDGDTIKPAGVISIQFRIL